MRVSADAADTSTASIVAVAGITQHEARDRHFGISRFVSEATLGVTHLLVTDIIPGYLRYSQLRQGELKGDTVCRCRLGNLGEGIGLTNASYKGENVDAQ